MDFSTRHRVQYCIPVMHMCILEISGSVCLGQNYSKDQDQLYNRKTSINDYSKIVYGCACCTYSQTARRYSLFECMAFNGLNSPWMQGSEALELLLWNSLDKPIGLTAPECSKSWSNISRIMQIKQWLTTLHNKPFPTRDARNTKTL